MLTPSNLPLTTLACCHVPLYFDSNGCDLFGWLCSPTQHKPRPLVGLVICNSFGNEAVFAHRAIQALAAEAAAIGIPSLRFDYSGVGDSADLKPEVNQIHSWVEDILSAARELQRRTSVERVCLVGFRLGALLAVTAAPKIDNLDALILIAPLINGKRYIAELRTLQLAVRSRTGAAPGLTEKAGVGDFEVGGYTLVEKSVNYLTQIDLATLTKAPARNLLILDRSDIPSAEAWSRAMSALGARTKYVTLSNFVQTMMRSPWGAEPPTTIVAATGAWLRQLVEMSGIGGPESFRPGTVSDYGQTSARKVVRTEAQVSAGLRERVQFFGSTPRLFGITTMPQGTSRSAAAVILVNDGACYHVGTNRLNVWLARLLAQRGLVVLRMDLAGIGDSEARVGRRLDDVFPKEAMDDIGSAIDFVRTGYGAEHITLAGVCSGAYHAFQAAVAGLPVRRILPINALNFFWKTGTPLDQLEWVGSPPKVQWYVGRLLSWGDWKRLFKGQINIRNTINTYFCVARNRLEAVLLAAARQLRMPQKNDLDVEINRLAARGVQMTFVFAQGERGLKLLETQAGSGLEYLAQWCRVHVIDVADHNFSSPRARTELEQILTDELLGERPRNSGAADRAGSTTAKCEA